MVLNTHSHSHTHTHTHTLTLTLSHSHTHTHTVTLNSHTLTLTLSHSFTFTHTLTPTHTLTHTLQFTHSHILTHTLTHSLSHSPKTVGLCFSGDGFDLDQLLLWSRFRDTMNMSSLLSCQGAEGPHLHSFPFYSQKEYSPQAVFHNENEKQRLNGSGKTDPPRTPWGCVQLIFL